MTNDRIKELALANGFKLKEQPDGNMDLNPYVYEFARVVFAKQHSDWISVDEQLPDIGQRVLTQKRGYVAICSLYRRGQGRLRWNDGRRLSDFEQYTHWMPLPQPPSEVQEKIYEQEMDKIKSCGCGCRLPDYLTQCPDCEVQDD